MAITHKALASVTVGSGGVQTIEFTSITSGFTDLIIKASLRCTADESGINFYFNTGASSTLYTWRDLRGNGTTSQSVFTTTYWTGFGGRMTPSSWTGSSFANNEIYIPNYSNTSNNKTAFVTVANENNATSANLAFVSNLWSSNDAITSVILKSSAGNFAQYSTATLYGIKNTV